ncbi:UDP-N-acetylmuramoylalanyl-D-glutamyl-2,6-diaminopimelate/D-alanyl-D-alanyl ligase [Caldicellulosiruptor owensensis OL]|uniref:UDP-N-acetylmuramoyl-tripeptide--D-alanyl-D-alanine ligase n=1 Tax=Caldicellulosiruptor owensensis (strain ATCC 700167 / DSM 13100 / OL) TaxID=632518 RepID=E4Q528_CALOW|nr:UDP-N-acetylmuramoyl-tripeptide--D-alanyl-D-alanine ligase [Caldicellulosiruptor owensensis]ADQ04195.1 UDP-N-acetylmuramoylalanyl-D-glutamyl-2,6-diaminopimelate/D-alanyl-D-alanyl ligase [Caldicellulosiruptor owensensis OL]
MNLWLSEIAKALNGEIKNFSDDILVSSFSLNSKNVSKNTLFIPLKGSRFDGHDFVEEALQNGAISFISQKEFKNVRVPYVKVKDTLVALQDLASYVRDKLKGLTVIGVTGSVGKTSTKEYIFNVLNYKYKTFKNQGNFNNHIGLPFSILNMPEDTQIAVFEMGMSNFGEISKLSQIAKPDIGVITNIGVAHIENLKSRYNIFLAKSEIQDGMADDGMLIINNDNDILNLHKGELKKRIITIGIENESHFRAKNVQRHQNGFSFEVDNYTYFIESFNFHDIYNSLFAIAVGIILGIDRQLIKEAIRRKERLKRRFEIIQKGSITVIDDTYNASTHSMLSAIDSICEFDGKKILVLGDMLELGEFSEEEHRKVGRYILQKPIDVVICTGKDAFYIFDEAKKKEGSRAYFVSKDECLDVLEREVTSNSTILFKASRGIKLDEIVDEFLKER